jgi:hypothetical protein
MTTKASVRATFNSYASVRERIMPTPKGQKLVLREGSATYGNAWAVAYVDATSGGQTIVLYLSTDTRIANERLSAALATLMEIHDAQGRKR